NARSFSHWGSQHRLRWQHDGCKSERRTNDKGSRNPTPVYKARARTEAECNRDTHATEKRGAQNRPDQQLLDRNPYPMAGDRICRLSSKSYLLLERTAQETTTTY